MSFRLKLFLSITVAVLVAVVIEGVLDVAMIEIRHRTEARINQQLSAFKDATVSALDLSGAEPRLNLEVLERFAHREPHLRLFRQGDLVLSTEAPFPHDEPGWVTATRTFGDGYRLEAALGLNLHERALSNPFFLDAIDVPLFFALAFGVAWILTRLVMRPVRDLTRAVRDLSLQRFPKPVAVPPGKDELGELAESFNHMTQAIQTLLERERSFTRYASHELRTPLSAFKVQLEALDMGLLPPEEVTPVLERNISRMEEVLTALLTLARSTEHDPAPVVLRSLIKEVLETFPQEYQGRLRMINHARARSQVTDAQLVHQALRNLLENAFRYSSGPVTLSVKEDAEMIVLCVGDSGPGVPEAKLREITKPFFRVGNHAESLGLGLALVENVARSLGGKLELKNTHPGLEATLTLPVYRG